MFVRLTLSLILNALSFALTTATFQSKTDSWFPQNPAQKNYGIAVCDINNDDNLDMFVTGFNAENAVYSYNKASGKLENIAQNDPYKALLDKDGAAIGVACCDLDGDGREEIYVLNTNGAYKGESHYAHKLFTWRKNNTGTYEFQDLYEDEENELPTRLFAGRSVACIDRKGTGRYSFIVATYTGSDERYGFGLIEMDEEKDNNSTEGKIFLRDAASEAGIANKVGGRAVAVGPILHDNGTQDIFFNNEVGCNNLYNNTKDGKFTDVARSANIDDCLSNGRGVSLADFNNDGFIDISYGNWVAEHKLFIQERTDNGEVSFTDMASDEMKEPTAIRTYMVADFDNNGDLDLFQNNIVYESYDASNKLFTIDADVNVNKMDIGDAKESDGYGTGGAYTDFDQDGVLELMTSHGESSDQRLEIYNVPEPSEGSTSIRIMPLTSSGAPARGAQVNITTTDNTQTEKTRYAWIDGGSGYLCQMEPVAHFGLPKGMKVKSVTVLWPDGETKTVDKGLGGYIKGKILKVKYPRNSNSNSNSNDL